MTEFLSDTSIAWHMEHIRQMKLKYSILEKSIQGLSGKEIFEIKHMRVPYCDREYATSLLADIKLHEIFFSSFSSMPYQRLSPIQRGYMSEASLFDEIYRKAIANKYGFLTVSLIGECPKVSVSDNYASLFANGSPLLAFDLCEHAYFLDYGFAQDKYVESALPYLDLSRLTGK